jgi:hypothetical protein
MKVNTSRLQDPVEIMDSKIDRLIENFVDEYTCMNCGKKCDYECACPDFLGLGPIVCDECLGFDPTEKIYGENA